MNFCSFIFLFTVTLRVLFALQKDLYRYDDKNSYRSSHKKISSLKCATKEPVYHEMPKNDTLYDNFVKYNKKIYKKNLNNGKDDKKYSRNMLNNKYSEDLFESVNMVEWCDYKNDMIKERNVISESNTVWKKTSWMTRFKNKLYKMIFKKNKFWKFISGIITVLGNSAIICEIIMLIGYIIKYFMCFCSCAYSCLCSCICSCSCLCSCICSCSCLCSCVCSCICSCVCTCICKCICSCVCSCVCTCICSCICSSVCTCACIYTSALGSALIAASGGILAAIILLIILTIIIVWLLVTWLWSHKDEYYKTSE
ncbi:hypothetical protein C923_00387 [Plasmodium falciparum UGT5.1]|uniref:Uncharacterized protein n=1 Tax=Plasmodium falciparum UGT5.1 TaxID=1237627 RepID=W7JIZ9_PLAFA|nr:hypothetical protein C923_00387 [Plasmodium falciparum UGT5.1]